MCRNRSKWVPVDQNSSTTIDHDGGVSYFVTQDSMGLFSTRCMDMSHVTSVQNENDPKCTILSLDHQTEFSLPPYVDTRNPFPITLSKILFHVHILEDKPDHLQSRVSLPQQEIETIFVYATILFIQNSSITTQTARHHPKNI